MVCYKFSKNGNKYNLDEFFNQLSILYVTPLYNRESVIIFDEIQRYPKARELIKHLVADGRYDYIETGSLISIKKKTKDILIPSEEEEISMHPLDFEEFLLANNVSVDTISYLKKCFASKTRIEKSIHNLILSLFKDYLISSGLPDAITEYVINRNVVKIRKVQQDTFNYYKDDFLSTICNAN